MESGEERDRLSLVLFSVRLGLEEVPGGSSSSCEVTTTEGMQISLNPSLLGAQVVENLLWVSGYNKVPTISFLCSGPSLSSSSEGENPLSSLSLLTEPPEET